MARRPDRWQALMARCAITPTGCWEWMGLTRGGYGRVKFEGRETTAHRLVYTLVVGPVDTALVLDHLCRNTLCVNPDHLEPVTRRENLKRGKRPPRYRHWYKNISFVGNIINGRGRSVLLLSSDGQHALRLTGNG